MTLPQRPLIEVAIVAVPETAGSALYGMVDVLLAAGNLWQTLVRSEEKTRLFSVRIVAVTDAPFACGNGIPVRPDFSVKDSYIPEIVILPEIWLGPDEDMKGRYPDLMDWICQQHANGAFIYSACSGAIMLASTGLLDGCDATSHWGYQDLFRKNFPNIRFKPAPNLILADVSGQIVTAGGTTSWHDLVIHIISRHCSPGEALRIAKVYLLKWHSEGQLPYESLVRNNIHADAVVKVCERSLQKFFRARDAIQKTVEQAKIPERTLKRRFKTATGSTLIEYLQNLRIEEAKHQLETNDKSVESICYEVGYEDVSFFRRLFKRLTGMTPSQYRQMFQPLLMVSNLAEKIDR
ncbi:GlxA family transcriptional regulator [Acaryochloris sp. CCMEE 5410]|uniref:GlxA family transcriptional regulator n=1 Tax=Acaryochloris sp. CCMEE 5410 TaxID=310037 RepID=UPI00024845CB|nr:helix-turn-helix domain-containing protein [Acaryochloris sp. CCMEE 5410]KAI9129273.1 helix-turn-helix domain-containing protein [Acaryochloris sp. CCMEE 5410]